MKKNIRTLIGTLSLVALLGTGCRNGERRVLESVGYGGVNYDCPESISVVFYDKNGERYSLDLLDRKFDSYASYSQREYKQNDRRVQGIYDVEIKPKDFFGGPYAKRIKRKNLSKEEQSRLEIEIKNAIKNHPVNHIYYKPN